jgi:hypothetical protein
MTVEAQSAVTQAQAVRSQAVRSQAVRPQAGDAEAGSCHASLTRLESLAAELDSRGLRTQLVSPAGRLPSLHVVNPAAAALAEDVYAGPGRDGQWWFWWSWAERIAASADPGAAASRISRVLAARD